MNVYKMEHLFNKMHKVERLREMTSMGLPKVILECETKVYNETKEKYPGIDEVYEEFLALKESSGYYVKHHNLDESEPILDEDGNEVGRYQDSVYDIRCKDNDKNVLGGLLFDSEGLANAYFYKVEKGNHPKFDELYKTYVESIEKKDAVNKKILKAIFGEE